VAASTNLTAPVISGNGHRGVMPPPGPALRTRDRRRRGLVAAGVVLVLACAVTVALLYARAGGKVSVIVMARPVAVGHTITRDDLATAQMSGDTIPAYAGGHMSEVIGKTAAVGLVTGQVLSPAMLTTRPPTPAGDVVVGVSLKPGQFPADGIAAGDMVMVILLLAPSVSGGSNAASVLDPSAQVVDAQTMPDSGGAVASLLIPRAEAAQVAQASSAGLVAVAQVAGR